MKVPQGTRRPHVVSHKSQGPQALAPSPPNRTRGLLPTSKTMAANDLGERDGVRGGANERFCPLTPAGAVCWWSSRVS